MLPLISALLLAAASQTPTATVTPLSSYQKAQPAAAMVPVPKPRSSVTPTTRPGANDLGAVARGIKLNHPAGETIIGVGTPAPTEPPQAQPAPAQLAPDLTTAIPTPKKSELAAISLEERIVPIAAMADEFDAKSRRYLDACQGKFTEMGGESVTVGQSEAVAMRASVGRVRFWGNWTTVSSYSASVANETTPYCRSLYSDIMAMGPRIIKLKDDAIQTMRHEGGQPGDVRRILRKYGMEW